MIPWNDWYHCTAHVYGNWLRGDPRGWRARHHREHVIGDYKNPPPPGKYAALYVYSKSLMKRDPVRIEWELREFVLDAMVRRFQQFHIELAVASLDGLHFHGLVRCEKHNPKICVGIAKQYATAQVKAQGFALGLKVGEGLWGKGSHAEPISSARHWNKTLGYIKDHGKRGAAVWARNEEIETDLEV